MELDLNSTVSPRSTAQWTDSKRYLWLIGLVVPSLVFLAFAGWALTGSGAWFWIGPVIVLVVVPLLDLVAGLDRANPPEDVIEALEEDRYYRWITYAFLPVQYVGFVASMYAIARGLPFGPGDGELSTLSKVALACTLGTAGGIGINTAHELGHKREAHERWLSKIALAQVAYGHFYIEHNRGHHVRVATPEDPASSRMGETFYEFWPRTVLGSVRSAWHLERKRYARRDQHPFRPGNDVLNAWAMTAVLWGGLVAWLGIGTVPYLLLQAVVGFTLLEVVNYTEHYGMLRQRVGKAERQRYERVDPSHSWNSNNIATNVLLYHLQRHSDHHANPTRRYQTLRDFEESPVLPTGYAGMIVLALVPPLFRRAMDERVVAHYDGDLTRANLSPRRRERLLAAYPPPAPVDERSPEQRVVDAAAAARAADAVTGEVLAARCPGCGHTYEVEQGNELEGFAAGTAWADVPDDWTCPDCGVRDKVDFVALDPTQVPR